MKETILQVDGMTCRSCVAHVGGALRELAGVDDVDVRLNEGIVWVRYDPASVSVEALLAAVREAGYESRPLAA